MLSSLGPHVPRWTSTLEGPPGSKRSRQSAQVCVLSLHAFEGPDHIIRRAGASARPAGARPEVVAQRPHERGGQILVVLSNRRGITGLRCGRTAGGSGHPPASRGERHEDRCIYHRAPPRAGRRRPREHFGHRRDVPARASCRARSPVTAEPLSQARPSSSHVSSRPTVGADRALNESPAARGGGCRRTNAAVRQDDRHQGSRPHSGVARIRPAGSQSSEPRDVCWQRLVSDLVVRQEGTEPRAIAAASARGSKYASRADGSFAMTCLSFRPRLPAVAAVDQRGLVIEWPATCRRTARTARKVAAGHLVHGRAEHLEPAGRTSGRISVGGGTMCRRRLSNDRRDARPDPAAVVAAVGRSFDSSTNRQLNDPRPKALVVTVRLIHAAKPA